MKLFGKAAEALENDSYIALALKALLELIAQLEVKMRESAKKFAFEERALSSPGTETGESRGRLSCSTSGQLIDRGHLCGASSLCSQGTPPNWHLRM